MSLEDAVQSNTIAVKALCETLKQFMGKLPPMGAAPVTPVAPIPAPAPEPMPAPVEVEQPKEPEPQPEPEIKKEDPTPVLSPDELRAALKPKVQKLFSSNAALGKQLLDEFGIARLSLLSDDQLPSFITRVDAALQGI